MKQHTRAAIPLLVTACLGAARVEAQVVAGGGGTFTLPYTVEWAGRTLAPGHYTVTMLPRRSATLFIKVSGQGRDLLLMPVELSSRDSGENRLALVASRGRRVVRALQVAGMTATFRTQDLDASGDRGPALAAADIASVEFLPVFGGR
jgi:hypothetical protein